MHYPRGVDSDKVWRDIKELVLKTIIASENYINSQIKANVRNKECVFELFGFDVMLDDKYKPWLIEVNISPSLHSTSGLDLNIKGPMLCHVLNLTGFRIPNQHWDRIPLTNDEKSKHAHFMSACPHEETSYMNSILETLTPDDMRMIIETEDEFTRKGSFQLVFPISQTIPHLKYFSIQRYYNLLLHAWFSNPHYKAGRGISMLREFARQGIPFKTQPPLMHVWTHKQRSLIKPLTLSPKKYKLPTLTGAKAKKKKVPKLK
ncbi:Tubulin polyglutamylase TTLL4-like [Oopsacas minuta]|uniref:Tubulin polyglutamylase TTLL4-like n=1 Tax=Oopsacas minuta TaxID=111878 RepID=A0AAV7K0Y9_9METZ|nr:Tubulin polyglutamylase TTLL4-like [Oopsacas minuta]